MRIFDNRTGIIYSFRSNRTRTIASLYFCSGQRTNSASMEWKLVATRSAEGLFLVCSLCGSSSRYRLPCSNCGDSKEEMRKVLRRARKLLKRERRQERNRIEEIRQQLPESSSNSVQGQDCSICLDGLDRDAVSRLVCRHTFHASCLSQWLVQNNTCPLCRCNINLN